MSRYRPLAARDLRILCTFDPDQPEWHGDGSDLWHSAHPEFATDLEVTGLREQFFQRNRNSWRASAMPAHICGPRPNARC